MALRAGTLLGPYEILSPLGGGGMGEVYRARDTRLDRTVAVKILPSNLADSPEARQRFEREARAVSSLNHPHICALFDVGRQDGIDFLVMECLEGETLADRLTRGPLPLDDLLRIGSQIAGALHAAHSRGVIHRDLKPGNIMLTKSSAKLMDFGLAKPAALSAGVTDLSSSPTVSKPLTAEGSIVGTFQYMAPEQLERMDVDARTDIFALGLVLYEMASGKRTFEGRTQASLIAAILKEEPPALADVAPMTPPALDRIVRACLAKDPDARWQSARDVQIQLNWLCDRQTGETTAATHAAPASRTREKFAWAIAAFFLILASLLAYTRFAPVTQPGQPVRASIMPPAGLSFVPDQFAISPDATRLAFVAVDANGKNTLWVRSLGAAGAQQLLGTEEATLPFWAPDSRRIGFFARGKLKTADLNSGTVQELCEARLGRGGTWSRDDVIVFAPFLAGPLFKVSANGGAPVAVTRTTERTGQAHRWPYFLPDGKHFLYFNDWSTPGDNSADGIYIASLVDPAAKRVSNEIVGNVAFAAGHLLYVHDRRLMAQPFDLSRIQLTGQAVALGERELEKDLAFSRAGFSVAENGTLVMQSTTDAPSRLIWFDAGGKELGQIPSAHLRDPDISPDGRLLAVTSDDLGNGRRFIRVFDLARGVSTRLSESGNEDSPKWSRDSKRIVFVSASGTSYSLVHAPVDGSAPPEVILSGAKMLPNDWTSDGRIVFMDFRKGAAELTMYSLADRKSNEHGLLAEAQISPDGKWVAFVAAGQAFGEIMVQAFPGPGARIQVSNSGGSQARWSHDGRQIFYIAPDRKLVAVSFDPQKQSAGVPRVLFQTRIVSPSFVLFQYDVAPDGRFLINSFPSDRPFPITLVTHWPQLLKR